MGPPPGPLLVSSHTAAPGAFLGQRCSGTGLGCFLFLTSQESLQRQLLDAVLMDTLEMVFFKKKNYFRTLNLDAVGTDFVLFGK